jgi:hypothetical protein
MVAGVVRKAADETNAVCGGEKGVRWDSKVVGWYISEIRYQERTAPLISVCEQWFGAGGNFWRRAIVVRAIDGVLRPPCDELNPVDGA